MASSDTGTKMVPRRCRGEWGTDAASLSLVPSGGDQEQQARRSNGGWAGGGRCCLVMVREVSGALPRARAGLGSRGWMQTLPRCTC